MIDLIFRLVIVNPATYVYMREPSRVFLTDGKLLHWIPNNVSTQSYSIVLFFLHSVELDS